LRVSIQYTANIIKAKISPVWIHLELPWIAANHECTVVGWD
jgi:hypothetical protein